MSHALALGARAPAAEADVAAWRAAFPALAKRVRGRPLVYLDSAATTQKPQVVIDAVAHAYEHLSANVHRGVHSLSEDATSAYEGARARVARFIGGDPGEVVFVRGATEGINLVAATLGHERVGAGDEVIISAMEHHANWVPWQRLCQAVGAHLKVVPLDARGDLDLEAYGQLLGPKTRVVALVHISNAIGTVNPIARMTAMARAATRAVVLVDGAQAAPHTTIDVAALGCDFYVLSAHKVFGPTGIGALWGRRALLEAMPVYQTGGDMILEVSEERTTFNEVPHKFEAGTPHIAGAIAWARALDFLADIGLDAVARHEARLLAHAKRALDAVPGLRRLGEPREQAAVVAFALDGVHPHDIGTVVDQDGIAIRTGHHCAQPLIRHYRLPASARCSMALYNTVDDIDALADSLGRLRRMFAAHG